MKRLTPKKIRGLAPGSEVLILIHATKSDKNENMWLGEDGSPVWYVYDTDTQEPGIEYYLLKKSND